MTVILVSGASGVVGYGTLRSLRQSKEKYTLIGTTIYDDSVAPAFCDIFELAPRTDDPSYMDWLCTIIEKHAVDMIIPGIESDMLKWSLERDRLAQTGVMALLNNSELVTLCGDKWEFYKKIQHMPLAIDSRLESDFDKLAQDFGLPFLLKPRRGFGSKGIVKIASRDDFAKHQDQMGTVLMAQPLVGHDDEEYTTSAFFDKDSRLCCLMTMKRKLSKEGFTEKAQTAHHPDIENAVCDLAALFKPAGPTNFQFRLHQGQLKLLEINPRISSATSIRTAFGYNESIMSVDYFLKNISPQKPVLKTGTAVRYTEEHIFYDRADL